jgi:hypothetical protein
LVNPPRAAIKCTHAQQQCGARAEFCQCRDPTTEWPTFTFFLLHMVVHWKICPSFLHVCIARWDPTWTAACLSMCSSKHNNGQSIIGSQTDTFSLSTAHARG